ncbi:MAG: UxaA family hydrolase, partial [Rhodospirillales bacterium]|nr:UxaA family hydrolase [Rhodospirillales bacterium]
MTATALPLIIRLDDGDNVVVACQAMAAGTEITAEGIVCRAAIPGGHKVATGQIVAGEPILKYGQIIGMAAENISPGSHVHDHNCLMATFDRPARHGQSATGTRPSMASREFQGYRQSDGQVGTRNYIGVLSTVNCSGSVARFIADEVNRSGLLSDYLQVDGIV